MKNDAKTKRVRNGSGENAKNKISANLKIVRFSNAWLRDPSRNLGIGETPTSRKSVKRYLDTLLAKLHPVVTDALLATFASGKMHPVITDALLATFITLYNKMKGKHNMSIFKSVKEKITPMDAAKHYGLKVNRNGMCCCPFHSDKHPSMKLDQKCGGGFYCFGCHETGDVITFTAKLFGIDNYEAAVKLADDFGIPVNNSSYISRTLSPEEIKRKKEAEEDRKYAVRKRDLYNNLLSVLSDMREVKFQAEERAMKVLEDNDTYCWVIKQIDRLDETYDFLLYNKDEDIKPVINRIESEVTKNAGEFYEIRRRSEGTSC